MRNGTELPLIGLVFIAALALLFAAWNANQVNLAAAQVGVTTLGNDAPEVAGGAAAVAGWIFNAGGVILFLAVLCLLGWLAWSFLQKQSRRNKWKSGPNAHWQQSGSHPRPLSTDEVLRTYMLRQMMGGQSGQPVIPQAQVFTEGDDAQINL
jgi:hypothetical protein